MTDITIRQSSVTDATGQTISHLVRMVNAVYDQSEKGMWRIEGGRANGPDMGSFLLSGKMLIAECDGKIVGSVKMGEVDESTYEFSMLVADPEFRGRGIGRLLADAVEELARKSGYKTMRLELLTPRDWINQDKEFLKEWYSRRGYSPSEPVPFESLYPQRRDHFACDCDFTVWLKEL